jgi:LysM repeat protein
MSTYEIKKGDTLSKIAKSHGVTVAAIQHVNRELIKDPNKISVGWVIHIPDGKDKDYGALGRKFEACLRDIEALDSFKELERLL